ncbi:hypothetical protein FJZ39_00480 [Candidatus Saccharibacteria bacterium]|nr:hypothetical protein [Candidatus Saccharibacteria bacterium]
MRLKFPSLTTHLQRKVSVLRGYIKYYKLRRPHRSFRRSYRSNYTRSLDIPGYWALTAEVFKVIWKLRAKFIVFIAVYVLAAIALTGIWSTATYINVQSAASQAADSSEGGRFVEAIYIFLSSVGSAFNGGSLASDQSEVQALISSIMLIFVWLSTVWLLRNVFAHKQVSARDALYTSGSSVLPTLIVSAIILVQLIPFALATVGYITLVSVGVFDNTVLLMLFFIAAICFALVSIYLVTSSLIALVIVTLPGMYPLRALSLAGDIVISRRIRILLRYAWLVILIAVMWLILLYPTIVVHQLLVESFNFMQYVPVVPIAVAILAVVSTILSATYVYVLYRKIVDDTAPPA